MLTVMATLSIDTVSRSTDAIMNYIRSTYIISSVFLLHGFLNLVRTLFGQDNYISPKFLFEL